MNPYQDSDFSSWADVQDAFRMKEPMPTEVLVAFYGWESYEGHAYVAYRRGRKFYVVEGGHCSCHGLEGQWEPTEYTKTAFKAYLKRLIDEGAKLTERLYGDSIHYFEQRNAAKLLELVA